MTVEGKLTNWHKEKTLHLRTHLADGTTPDGIKFDVSLNIDNKAVFVEFPDGWAVEYSTLDLVKNANELYQKREELTGN